jgi:hypothetical protein
MPASLSDTSGELVCAVFLGTKCLASGALTAVVPKAKAAFDRRLREPLFIFNTHTSELVELELSGSLPQVIERARLLARPPAPDEEETVTPTSRGPGRPRLGVVGKEVTLLPRHWEWLNSQPGGPSVALRKLVEEARKTNREKDQVRSAREVCYRFILAMGGDEAGFEEATRALFAGDKSKFEQTMARWPADVRKHALMIGAPGLV